MIAKNTPWVEAGRRPCWRGSGWRDRRASGLDAPPPVNPAAASRHQLPQRESDQAVRHEADDGRVCVRHLAEVGSTGAWMTTPDSRAAATPTTGCLQLLALRTTNLAGSTSACNC